MGFDVPTGQTIYNLTQSKCMRRAGSPLSELHAFTCLVVPQVRLCEGR